VSVDRKNKVVVLRREKSRAVLIIPFPSTGTGKWAIRRNHQ
jgi:hypothetical protein